MKIADTLTDNHDVSDPEIGETPSLSLQPEAVDEVDGPSGPEPTRFGDWERKGRCVDF